MKYSHAITLVPLLLSIVGPSFSMTISSNCPGNVVVAGKPSVFTVDGAPGDVRYILTDYFGEKVFEGSVSAANGAVTISIPGLKPGWYEITCTAGAESTSASIGALIDRGNSPLPQDGRVCSDAASSWLIRNDDYRPAFAKIVRLAGISWVRERMSWDVETAPGKYNWSGYQPTMDLLSKEGVHISTTWHDCASWTRLSHPDDRYPDDLRDVYRFAKALSSHFTGKVQALEVWNEPDALFWPKLGDRFAGLQKAAYLGIKDGNPDTIVLNGSWCMGVVPFDSNVCDSGAGNYFDAFNWHIYSNPNEYDRVLDTYKVLLRECGVQPKPIWLTECGISVPGTEGPNKRLLNTANQQKQCRFVPRSVSSALAAGTDRYFFFVLPDYLEGEVQFGTLHPDLTPYPSFIALSAAANILGQSQYLGQYKPAGDSNAVTAYAFSTPKGNVLVAWADEPTQIQIPTNKPQVAFANIFGNESQLASKGGSVEVKVGPEAVYLMDIGNGIRGELKNAPAKQNIAAIKNPSRVVVVGHCDLPINKVKDCYILTESNKTMQYTVEVYNFDEKKGAEGTIKLALPKGWKTNKSEQWVKLGSMDKKVLTFDIVPGKFSLVPCRITAEPQFEGQRVYPSMSSFMADASLLKPVECKQLNYADAAKWHPECSSNGIVEVTNAGPNGLRFTARFNQPGDRWAYPVLNFAKPEDYTGYDGIAFHLKVISPGRRTRVSIMLVESGQKSLPHYLTGTDANVAEQRVVLLFRDMGRLYFMGEDNNNMLDLDSIGALKLGCNTPDNEAIFEVQDMELVKFKH